MDERGDEIERIEMIRNEYVLASVAYALYTTIESKLPLEKFVMVIFFLLTWRTVLNRPLAKPRSMAPTDIIHALERKTNGQINREQQVLGKREGWGKPRTQNRLGCARAVSDHLARFVLRRRCPVPQRPLVSAGRRRRPQNGHR